LFLLSIPCVNCNNSRAECYNYDQGTGYDYIKYYCTFLEDKGEDGFLGETKRKNNYIIIPNRCPFIVRKNKADRFFRYIKVELVFDILKELPKDFYFKVNGIISNFGIDWIEFNQRKVDVTKEEVIVYLDKPDIDSEDKYSLYDFYTSNIGVDSVSIATSFCDMKGGKSMKSEDYLKFKSIKVHDRSENKV
jgi:hypothetical protein